MNHFHVITILLRSEIMMMRMKLLQTHLMTKCLKKVTQISVMYRCRIQSQTTFSKEPLSRLLYILHTFILPRHNTLPSSYEAALRKINPNLITPKEFDCCSNDCLIFRNAYAHLTKCPKCDEQRYKDRSTQPRKRFKYLPVLPRIERMFSIPSLSKLLQQHASAGETVIHDIHQSSVWKNLYSPEGQYEGDARAISFALCTDGMNPLSKEKTSYSMWPISLSILNLPSHMRTKFGSLLLFGIIPGRKKPKNIDTYLELLVEEINNFSNCDIFDSFNGVYFKPKASIVLNILDYPGQNKVFKCSGKLFVMIASDCSYLCNNVFANDCMLRLFNV